MFSKDKKCNQGTSDRSFNNQVFWNFGWLETSDGPLHIFEYLTGHPTMPKIAELTVTSNFVDDVDMEFSLTIWTFQNFHLLSSGMDHKRKFVVSGLQMDKFGQNFTDQ
ncbi:hypothetical protein CRE_02330 [Caenorhabditis remanei]|uniref:Uncharacterized protein n=1 Tax=Caenorhabditis remanei TaxID=31234 RepID=E3MII0_CAERE|nr:hypothetical protein CRE_02330 [Caenorhabditis remanei]